MIPMFYSCTLNATTTISRCCPKLQNLKYSTNYLKPQLTPLKANETMTTLQNV